MLRAGKVYMSTRKHVNPSTKQGIYVIHIHIHLARGGKLYREPENKRRNSLYNRYEEAKPKENK